MDFGLHEGDQRDKMKIKRNKGMEEKNTVCIYKCLRQYANWFRRNEYNCFNCLRDERNKNCPYFVEVSPYICFDVVEEK